MSRASVWLAAITLGVLLGCSGASTTPPATTEGQPARAKPADPPDCGAFCKRFVDCGSGVDPIDCLATCEAELGSPKGRRTVECVVAASDCAAKDACYAN